VSNVTLPSTMPYLVGHHATVFDFDSCEMMMVDLATKTATMCSKNYHWTSRNAADKLGNVEVPLMPMDASFFGPHYE